MGLIVFWSQHIFQLDVFIWPIYNAIWKGASFEWGQEKEKSLQQVEVVLQASLPHGENDAIDPQFLMYQWQRGMLEALEGLHMWTADQALSMLEQSLVILRR